MGTEKPLRYTSSLQRSVTAEWAASTPGKYQLEVAVAEDGVSVLAE